MMNVKQTVSMLAGNAETHNQTSIQADSFISSLAQVVAKQGTGQEMEEMNALDKTIKALQEMVTLMVGIDDAQKESIQTLISQAKKTAKTIRSEKTGISDFNQALLGEITTQQDHMAKTKILTDERDTAMREGVATQMEEANLYIQESRSAIVDLEQQLEAVTAQDADDTEVSIPTVDLAKEARDIDCRSYMKNFDRIQKSLSYLPGFNCSTASPLQLGNRLIAWFRELEVQLMVSVVVHPRTLDILGSKFSGVMSSRHRIALSVDVVADARAQATRLHRSLTTAYNTDDASDSNSNIFLNQSTPSQTTSSTAKEAMVRYAEAAVAAYELYKSALLNACLPDLHQIERAHWLSSDIGGRLGAQFHRDILESDALLKFLGADLKRKCRKCCCIDTMWKLPIEFVEWCKELRPTQWAEVRQSYSLPRLFELVSDWEALPSTLRGGNSRTSRPQFSTNHRSRPPYTAQARQPRYQRGTRSRSSSVRAIGVSGAKPSATAHRKSADRLPPGDESAKPPVCGTDGQTRNDSTTCRVCGRRGHWGSECPQAASQGQSRNARSGFSDPRRAQGRQNAARNGQSTRTAFRLQGDGRGNRTGTGQRSENRRAPPHQRGTVD